MSSLASASQAPAAPPPPPGTALVTAEPPPQPGTALVPAAPPPPPGTALAQHNYSAPHAYFAQPLHQHPHALPASSHSYPSPNAAASSALYTVEEPGNPIPPPAEPYAHNAGYYGAPPYAYPVGGPASASAIFNQVIDPQIYGAIGSTTIPVMSMIPEGGNAPYVGNMWLQPASQLVNKQKNVKKKKPAVQPAYCEVCKIECNAEEVLKTHKLGKKHKKNLQKLQESIAPKPATAQSVQNAKKRTATLHELELKKRRVIEGGAAAEGVKVCTVCNVVVNSQGVYDSHLAGQKHAAMVKKLQEQHNVLKDN